MDSVNHEVMRMHIVQPIIKADTRILRPSEYAILRDALKPEQKMRLDGTLVTGMRLSEFIRFRKLIFKAAS